MNTFVVLLFVLVGSMVERSDAVSCYNCVDTTCPEPLNPTTSPKCSGPVCTITFTNVTVFTSFQRNCSNDANSPGDECQRQKQLLTTTPYNYTYYGNYTNGNTCCLNMESPLGPTTFCACNADNCNDNIPPNTGTSTATMPSAVNTPTTTANTYLPSTTSYMYTPPNAGFASKPVDSLTVIIPLIITAVLSTIN